MLKSAVKSGIPLIAVTTRDTINTLEVLARVITDKKIQLYNLSSAITFKKGVLYVSIGDSRETKIYKFEKVYKEMVASQAQLLLVNYTNLGDIPFSVGELPVPKDMLGSFLSSVVGEGKAAPLVTALGGTTLKESAELAMLTMANHKSLTAQGLMDTRKSFFQGSKGITLVDTEQDYYEPEDALKSWVDRESVYFLNSCDKRLIPRGLLFDGEPGTGKTSGAKYVAKRLGVPLYRFDLASMKQKYVGESEGNIRAAMSQLDREEPCVAIIDEVEKVLGNGGGSDSGTTVNMMAQLLWWLAERTSKVLVIMTTNDIGKLPPELYRSGRVDEVITLEGVCEPHVTSFVKGLLKTFDLKGCGPEDKEELEKAVICRVNKTLTIGGKVPQAVITTTLYQTIKSMGLGH